MATDIILRSVKAAALTHAEMDQNWESLAGTVDIHVASATIAVTDQNKIIETNIATGTMTLPTVANAAGTDTDSFRVIVKNINATVVIVDGNGAETIEGAASVSLLQYEAAEFTLDGAGTGWTIASYYGPNLVGITSTPTEINKLDGFTGVVADLNIIAAAAAAGVTATEFQYLNGVTSAIQTQLTARLVAASNLSDLASAATSRSNLGVDAAGTDNSTDVTLAGTPDYITIAGQVITRGAVVLTTDVSGTLPVANGGTNATTASAARTSLGLAIGSDIDAAGTDNSTDVTLSGTPDYISIVGQVITRNAVDLAADVTGVLPAGNIGTNAVTTAKINALAVTTAKIAASAVTATEIATGAVGQSEVASAAVGRGELITATVSLAGSVAVGNLVAIALTAYAFFPMIHSTNDTNQTMRMQGHRTDGASADSPRFEFYNSTGYTQTYDVDYRYIGA